MSATRGYAGDLRAVINPCMFRDPKKVLTRVLCGYPHITPQVTRARTIFCRINSSAHAPAPPLQPHQQFPRPRFLASREQSVDLRVLVCQILWSVLKHQVEPDLRDVLAHPLDDRRGAAFDMSWQHKLPQQDF